MCEPATVIAIAGTVMQGYSAKQQGKYQEGVGRYNARVAENEAQDIRNAATERELDSRRATAELRSRQRAQLAAQGVQLDTGSALALQEDTQRLGEIDALRIRQSGDDAFTAKMDESRFELAKGKAAGKAGRNALTASLLTAAAGVAAHGISSGWFTSKSAANQVGMTGTGQQFAAFA